MAKNYYKFIKDIRLKRGLSQVDVAKKIGISRSSYIALEQGKRDLSLAEAQKISDFFGVALKDIGNGTSSNYPKYKEMILAYLRNSGSDDGKLPKTKLAKLLYLADFAWFYNNFESMSGMQYRRNHYGPVPDMYFRALDELEDEGKINIDRTKNGVVLIREARRSEKDILSNITKDEIALIKAISKKWQGKRTQEIVNFTHNQLPFKICSPDEIIPYELIIQEDPADVY